MLFACGSSGSMALRQQSTPTPVICAVLFYLRCRRFFFDCFAAGSIKHRLFFRTYVSVFQDPRKKGGLLVSFATAVVLAVFTTL